MLGKFLCHIRFRLGLDVETCYDHLQNKLNIKSLHERSINFNKIFIYKILNNNIDCSDLLQLIHIHAPPRSLRVVNTFSIENHRTNYGQSSSINRMMFYANEMRIDLFNTSLPYLRTAFNDQ